MAPAELLDIAGQRIEDGSNVQEFVLPDSVGHAAGLICRKVEVGNDTVVAFAKNNFHPPAIEVAIETTPEGEPAEVGVHLGETALSNLQVAADALKTAAALAGKQSSIVEPGQINTDLHLPDLYAREDGAQVLRFIARPSVDIEQGLPWTSEQLARAV